MVVSVMKARPLTPLLWLLILLPSVAHASSFALVLYPSGALTAIVITCVIFAGGKRTSIRVAAAIAAILVAAAIPFIPTDFYSTNPSQYLRQWAGEWYFFILGLVPTSLVAILVLKLAAHAPRRRDA